LTKTFGPHLAVDHLTFEACPGKVTVQVMNSTSEMTAWYTALELQRTFSERSASGRRTLGERLPN
jgi:hypothetical protein